jgi:orotidine-5'-phosphate decarboxylase
MQGDAKGRIIVALDTADPMEMLRWAEMLGPRVGGFKIGLTAITAIALGRMDPGIIELVAACGNDERCIFYDGKFHDIPETIAGASKVVGESASTMFFNLHASADIDAMKRAMNVAGGAKVLAVTVLTSMDDRGSMRIYGRDARRKVLDFADIALEARLDGLVCSPAELMPLSVPKYSGLLKVTPGVRPTWAAKNDQVRVMTPLDAIRLGADYLVIGRPILKPPSGIGSPIQAAQEIAAEIAMGLAAR